MLPRKDKLQTSNRRLDIRERCAVLTIGRAAFEELYTMRHGSMGLWIEVRGQCHDVVAISPRLVRGGAPNRSGL